MARTKTPPSDDLSQSLRDLVEKCHDEREFLREWRGIGLLHFRETHPRGPRKRPGPAPTLDPLQIFKATESVLDALVLKPRVWNTLRWPQLMDEVQARLEKEVNGGRLYAAETIRPYVRWYVYLVRPWDEIPPRLSPFMSWGTVRPRRRLLKLDKRHADRLFPAPEAIRDKQRRTRIQRTIDDLRRATAVWLTGPKS